MWNLTTAERSPNDTRRLQCLDEKHKHRAGAISPDAVAGYQKDHKDGPDSCHVSENCQGGNHARTVCHYATNQVEKPGQNNRGGKDDFPRLIGIALNEKGDTDGNSEQAN